jgi:hypothetical protein
MSRHSPSAAFYLCSLCDDELRAVLFCLPGTTFGACARVCSRWKSTVDNEDHWQCLLRREYGMGETVVDVNDIVSRAVGSWKMLYRICHSSLFSSASGGVAARRAYFDADGRRAIRTLETTVIRAPLLRHSFSPSPGDAYADILPLAVESCSDTGVSEYSYAYPIANAFESGPLGYQCEEYLKTSNPERADLPSRDIRLLINGHDALLLLTTDRYPVGRQLTPRSWSTSRGANENVNVILQLHRPCIVTGVMICNPGGGFDNHVRDALVFVGSTKEEVEPLASRYTSFSRHPSGYVDASPQLGPEASTLSHLRLPWKAAPARTRTGREPYALVEFSQGPKSGTQCFAFGPPTLVRYVRVQFLSQFNPKEFPFEEINFDVNSICVLGTELVASPHMKGAAW